MNKEQFEILETLINKPCVSMQDLLESTELSKKKLLEEISFLTTVLKENQIGMLNVQNKTLKLNITDLIRFEQFYKNCQNCIQSEDMQEDRISFLLIKLLSCKGYLKIEELADNLFVSSRQISKDLQKVRDYLVQYELTIKSTPHYGIMISGSEFKKRICLAEIYTKNNQYITDDDSLGANHKQIINEIREILSKIINQYQYLISDVIFENLVVHLFVAILRIQNGYEMNHIEPGKVKNTKEIKIARSIIDALGARFQVRFDENECSYITAHLESKQNYDSEYAKAVPAEIGELVMEFLNRIDQRYNTNLLSDFKLCMVLSLHFMPLLARLEYGLRQKNPLLDEIKTRFIYEFELANVGCQVIKEKYQYTVCEDEVGYIALDLRMSIEKRYEKSKYNILLVCSTGRGSAELLKMKFTESFEQYIEQLDLCSSRNIDKNDPDRYDYIFSTVPLFVKTKTPIMRVSCFLGQEDIIEIGGVFRNAGRKNEQVLRYFDKCLFMGLCDFKSKSETLERMTEHIAKYKPIPANFLDSVLDREKEANTSFGNKVAFPHPRELLSEETFICTAILNKPILWGNNKVQVVFMASIEKNNNKDLQSFYKTLSKIIDNEAYVNQLIANPSCETLYHMIQS